MIIKEQSTPQEEYTHEEYRKELYQTMKGNTSIPYGKEKKLYTFKELEVNKSQAQKDALYEAWGHLFFSSIGRLPGYPSSGILDLYKIAKGVIKNFTLTQEEFFYTYACDLDFVKSKNYCVQPQRNFEDYYGDYENEKIGIAHILVDTNPKTLQEFNRFEIEKDPDTIFELELTNKTDRLDLFVHVQNIKSPVPIGTLRFECEEPDADKLIYCNFKLNITHPKYTGLYEFKSLKPTPDDSTDDDQDQIVTVNKKPEPKPIEVPKPKIEPTPPKPQKTQNYCSLESLEKSKWKIGCENDIIGLLNKKFLGGRHGNSLTQELIDELKNLDWISSGDGITKDEYNVLRSKVPDLKKLEENKKIKKIIKESVRRNLKDIYYRS